MASDNENDSNMDSRFPRYASTCRPTTRKFKEREPDRFDGTTSWTEYWAHFDACWELNQWSNEEAALVLAASLSKSACKVLIPKPKGSFGNFRSFTIEELKGRLDRRYGPSGLAESYQAKLNAKRQGPNETLQELGYSIAELVRLAYLDVPNDFMERMSVIHFRDSVTEAEIRSALFRSKPTSLDESIKIAVEADSFLQMEASRDKPRTVGTVKSCKITNGIGERLAQIEKRQDELVKMLSDLTTSAQRSRERPRRSQMMPRKCFHCHKFGHIKKKCPYRPRRDQPSVRSQQTDHQSVPRVIVRSPSTNGRNVSSESQVEDCNTKVLDQSPTDPTVHADRQISAGEEKAITDFNQVIAAAVSVEKSMSSTENESLLNSDATESLCTVSEVCCNDEKEVVAEVVSNVNDGCSDSVCLDNAVDGVNGKEATDRLGYHGMTLGNTPLCSGGEMTWKPWSFIGYVCICVDMNLYHGGVVCLVWPVYGMWEVIDN